MNGEKKEYIEISCLMAPLIKGVFGLPPFFYPFSFFTCLNHIIYKITKKKNYSWVGGLVFFFPSFVIQNFILLEQIDTYIHIKVLGLYRIGLGQVNPTFFFQNFLIQCKIEPNFYRLFFFKTF